MAERESARHTSRRVEATEDVDASDAAARKEKIDIDVDAMLDEIDDVLEENAEEFVRGFVQKGGQ
jgi:ubiquitin-like protein Pup